MLDIVDRERVARQQDIDVAGANHVAEVRGAAGVHEDRAGDKRNPSACPLHVGHHRRDARDGYLDAPLR